LTGLKYRDLGPQIPPRFLRLNIVTSPPSLPDPIPPSRPVSVFKPRKVDRRHRPPPPPKKKEPEIYIPGSSIMPDLDVFIRPHLYRGVAPDKLPKSGVGGKPLEPIP
jgi:hypothetical protein